MEQCSDYKEALKCKFHLSYLLGQALIKAHKTWHKGGYLRLHSYIQKARQTYKEFKEFDEERILDTHHLALIFEDKDKLKFFREYRKEFKLLLENTEPNDVKNLSLEELILSCIHLKNPIPSYSSLKTIGILFEDFKNYKALTIALKQTLAHDLNFVFRNLDSIEKWLYSKEFKEKYQDKLHAYPPLLNPKKIDYGNTPAELAWEMNLVLPKNYKFIHIGSHGVGVLALVRQLYNCCNIFCRLSWATSKTNSPKSKYCVHFNDLITNDKQALIISFSEALHSADSKKYLSLTMDPDAQILYQVRDPISIIKHAYGRYYHWDIYEKLNRSFNLTFDWRSYINPFKDYKKKIFQMNMDKLKTSSFIFNFFQDKISLDKIHYLDMTEVLPKKAFNTLQNLAEIFDFSQPNNENIDIIEVREFKGFLRYILPLTLYVDSDDLKNIFSLNNTNNVKNLNINKNGFKITICRFSKDIKEYCIVDEFGKNDLFQDVRVYMNKDEFSALKKEYLLYKAVKEYLSEFFQYLEDANKHYEEKALSNEEDVLEYLRKNDGIRLDLKTVLDEELKHIRTHRPDIVASWKYYQEFEKMCEELDKN